MYKVSEVADIIGVEKVEIFEKMISHKSILDPSIFKRDGITYFDERGLEILKTLFHTNTAVDLKIEQEILKESKSNNPKNKKDKEYDILKNKIQILTNELSNLDEELELKDEILLKHQFKLLEDLDTLSKLQYSLLKKLERQVK